jgi:hypothetical protein
VAPEDDFETRLARARPGNRAQYLRIEGVERTAAEDAPTRAAGRDLLRRILRDNPGDELQATWARRDLAASLA